MCVIITGKVSMGHQKTKLYTIDSPVYILQFWILVVLDTSITTKVIRSKTQIVHFSQVIK